MNKYPAETTLSLLIAILIFSLLVLFFGRWQTSQHQQINQHFQRQQAVQILENQLALTLAELDCESSVTQNQIRYDIQCTGSQKRIRFPLGSIELNND